MVCSPEFYKANISCFGNTVKYFSIEVFDLKRHIVFLLKIS